MSSGGLTPGDPLGGGAGAGGSAEGERLHESGLPMPPSAPSSYGYTSPPPPGAGGTRASVPSVGGGDLVLAGWWRRAVAALIDGLIVTVIAGFILAALGIGLAGTDGDTGTVAFVAALFVSFLVLAVAGFLYAPVLMARTGGQTFGRMATGIRVVRVDRAPMTFGWAMLREVAVKGILINAIGGTLTGGVLPVLDVLWPLWDEENRALHDFVVQTRTVMA